MPPAARPSPPEDGRASVDLYWIPLGAGAHVVRLSGALYEALAAWAGRRPRSALYHSALVVTVPERTYAIEMTPVPDRFGAARGAQVEGAVGSRWFRPLRHLRYEIRCWPDGVIGDLAAAVASPVTVVESLEQARSILASVPLVPTLVWGRDELRAGEMWNSNSVTSWLLATNGVDLAAVRPPLGGRAPGWDAGQLVARRDHEGRPRLAPT